MKTPILIAATLLPALLLTARPADACSLPFPYIESMAPADGATLASSNPALFLYFPYGQARHQVTYEVVGSTTTIDLGEIPDALSADPVGTLALPTASAGTQARVTLTPLEGGGETKTTIFTYGAAEDVTAPAAPPAPVLDVTAVKADGNSCGPSTDGDEVSVGVPTGLDSDVVGYAVIATSRGLDLPAQSRPLERKRWTLLADDRAALNLGFYSDAQDVCVVARAVDQAGNWSAPSAEACVPVNSGCTAAQGSLPIFGALGLWLGLAGLLRRRRA